MVGRERESKGLRDLIRVFTSKEKVCEEREERRERREISERVRFVGERVRRGRGRGKGKGR